MKKKIVRKLKKILLDNQEVQDQPHIPYFDSNYYFQNNLDVFVSGLNPQEHFLANGQFEGRDPARLISSDWLTFKYSNKSNNPFRLVIESIGTPDELSPNPIFDPSFYLEQIGGAVNLGGNAAYDHFLKFGLEQGLRPNKWLNLELFAKSNPWFFNSAKTNLEKFTNFFEIIRKEMFFDPYLCFAVENSRSERIQISRNLLFEYLNHLNLTDVTFSQFKISNWEFIELIQLMSKSDFEELNYLESVKNYPPNLEDYRVNFSNQLEDNPANIVFYCHWDPENKVSEWIETAISTWRSLGFKVVFSTNVDFRFLPEFVFNKSLAVLKRTNSGHDFESHVMSWNWLQNEKIDPKKLVLTNDSVFFPASNTAELQKKLGSNDWGFWSLTENFWSQNHLQSYLLVLNNNLINSYFNWLTNRLSKWKIISKMGLINTVELYSHEFANLNGVVPQSMFKGNDPTFNSWDELIAKNIPILKVHLIRKFLTVSQIDNELFRKKLEKVLSNSHLKVEDIMDHARRMEINNVHAKYWYNQ